MIVNAGIDTVVDLYGKDPAQAASVWSAIGLAVTMQLRRKTEHLRIAQKAASDAVIW